MRNYIRDIFFAWYKRSSRSQKALEGFSKAIRTYLTSVVTHGPTGLRGALITPFGGVDIDNNLDWEDFRFIDDGMTPPYKQAMENIQPYGYVGFNFVYTRYSWYFFQYLYQKLEDEGYNIHMYASGYVLSIFVSTDKVYAEKPYPYITITTEN